MSVSGIELPRETPAPLRARGGGHRAGPGRHPDARICRTGSPPACPRCCAGARNPAGLVEGAAARHGRRTAIIDDEGSLTYAELDARTSALARTWSEAGIARGTAVGDPVRQPAACSWRRRTAAHKLGCDIVYLNTGFSAPQVADVVHAEGVDVLVYDDEHATTGRPGHAGRRGHRGRADAGRRATDGRVKPIRSPGRVVVLTSGTTGRPKGAARHERRQPAGHGRRAGLHPVHVRRHDGGGRTALPRPRAVRLRALHWRSARPIVLRRRFDPEETLRDISAHGAEALVVVPVMLQRILALPPRVLNRYDTSTLRILLCSGAALSGDLALTGARPLRRRGLQPLRLDRGGAGHDRRPARPARRARHGRPPDAGRDRQGDRRPRAGGLEPAHGRLHRRRLQGPRGQPRGHGRPRPLRPLGPAVHRRPRGRHDRLRRRERVPRRGGGRRWPATRTCSRSR